MGRYAAVSNKTNTVSATVPMWNLVGAATRRLKVFEIQIGSDAAPDDQASKFALRRTTADGSPLTTFTPTKLDPADGASIATKDLTWTGAAEPTITANSDLLNPAFNQRTWYRHVAREGAEFVVPAVAEAGLALLSVVATAAANHAFTIQWEE